MSPLVPYYTLIVVNETIQKLYKIRGNSKCSLGRQKFLRYSNEVVRANDLQMETRCHTMMAMALDSGCKTEVDLPCGYPPGAIQVTRQGMHFVDLLKIEA